jgi:response regulator of citrate/malate metabolism
MIDVMILEDDPMVREINEKFLKKLEGFRLAGSVSSVNEAKLIIEKEVPDLVLLDVFLPTGRGTELLKWIRENDLDVDAIFITADKTVLTVENSLRAGAFDYLIKPFKFERFERALLDYKKKKMSLKREEIDQETIDDILAKSARIKNEIDDVAQMKGFSQHTYDRVLECVRSYKEGVFTAQKIAVETGVSRITSRRYLDYLEKEGVLVMELEYGKVGRPKNNYKIRIKS